MNAALSPLRQMGIRILNYLNDWRCSSDPLQKPSVDGLKKEGGLDRCFQLRLGGAVQWQTSFRPLVEKGRSHSHQLPANTGSMFGTSYLLSNLRAQAPRPSPLGQYDGGVLYKSPGRSFLEAPLYSSSALLEVGSAQLALAESNACAGQA